MAEQDTFDLTFNVMWALGIPIDMLVGDTHYSTTEVAILHSSLSRSVPKPKKRGDTDDE